MKALFLILFSISTLSACSKTNNKMQVNTPLPTPAEPVATDTLSYLALGDSYTIGESITAKQSFPYQVAAQLTGHKVSEPYIIARTGWTTDQLISAVDDDGAIKEKIYNFVTLLVGVNDQYQGLSKENYRAKFVQILNTAIKFAGGNVKHVFVLSIPDYGVTPFAQGNDAIIAPEIDAFNAINRSESAKAGVAYTDITGISKQAAFDAGLIANDGLHPSAKMYSLWVQKLLPEILAQFKK